MKRFAVPKLGIGDILKLILIIFFLSAMFVGLSKLGHVLDGPQVHEFIKQSGIWTPLLILAIYVFTIVVAPLTGFPVVILTFSLYGPLVTIIINLFASAIGGSINFWISRRYGRTVIKKLVGDGGVKKVDGLTGHLGTEVLILTRLFQGFLFEWISYAAGLTKIPYKKYIFITMWASIPYNLLLYFFALKFNDLGQLFISLTAVNYFLLTIPPIYFFLKRDMFKRKIVR